MKRGSILLLVLCAQPLHGLVATVRSPQLAGRAVANQKLHTVARTGVITAADTVLEPDFRLAAALAVLGPTLVLAPWIIQGVGGFFGLLGFFLIFQTLRIRFVFDDVALEVKTKDLFGGGDDLGDTGENFGESCASETRPDTTCSPSRCPLTLTLSTDPGQPWAAPTAGSMTASSTGSSSRRWTCPSWSTSRRPRRRRTSGTSAPASGPTAPTPSPRARSRGRCKRIETAGQPSSCVKLGTPTTQTVCEHTPTCPSPNATRALGQAARAKPPPTQRHPTQVHFFPCITDAQKLKAQFEAKGCAKL